MTREPQLNMTFGGVELPASCEICVGFVQSSSCWTATGTGVAAGLPLRSKALNSRLAVSDCGPVPTNCGRGCAFEWREGCVCQVADLVTLTVEGLNSQAISPGWSRVVSLA